MFQQKIDETYRNFRGAVGIADVQQIHSKMKKEYGHHLHELMKNTQRSGIKMNVKICIIKCKKVSSFGVIYIPNKVKKKVATKTKMKSAKNKKELHSFLSMI